MRSKIVTVAKDAAYQILEALDYAIDLAADLGYFAEHICFEDAFERLRDAMFPDLSDC